MRVLIEKPAGRKARPAAGVAMRTRVLRINKITRRKDPAAARPRDSSAANLKKQLEQRTRELAGGYQSVSKCNSIN
jgi:hypothetical protein